MYSFLNFYIAVTGVHITYALSFFFQFFLQKNNISGQDISYFSPNQNSKILINN